MIFSFVQIRSRCFLFILVLLADIALGGYATSAADQGAIQALIRGEATGVLNVKVFGASANNNIVAVTTKKGTSEISIASSSTAGSFVSGQSVVVLHAGPPAVVDVPSGLTSRALSYGPNGVVAFPGCHVDSRNSSCGATWTWNVVAVDSLDGSSAPSSTARAEKAPQQPNPDDRIQLVWNSDPNAEGYLVYGCEGLGCEPTLRAVLPNNWYISKNGWPCQGCQRPSFMVYDYLGHDFGIDEVTGKSMPRFARNEMLFARVESISDGGARLSAAAVVSISTRMLHDDSPAFQAAIDRAKSKNGTTGSNGGIVLIPPGQYPLARTLSFYRSTNLRFSGIGSEGSDNETQFIWHGGVGGKVFDLNQARDLTFDNFAVTDNNGGSTPGVILDIDKFDRGEGIKYITTHDTFTNLSLQRSGVAVRIGNRSDGNCEMMRFENVIVDSPWNGEGGWIGYYIAGGGQSYDERLDGGSIGLRDLGILINSAGSIDTYALNLTHNWIDWYINGIPFDHISEIGSDSEWAAHHLYVAFASTMPFRMAIYDSRLVSPPNRIASNYLYIIDNASNGLRLVGNQIRQTGYGPCKIMVSAGSASSSAPLVSMQNFFGDPHPFVSPPGVRLALISVDDTACIDPKCEKAVISPPLNPDVARLLLSLANVPVRGVAAVHAR